MSAIGRNPVEWESISMSSFITDCANSNVLNELENLKKGAENLRKMSEAGKRSAADQSPGKTDEDDDWTVVSDKKGGAVKNNKKKLKEKSKEALEIEKSLYDEK